MYYVRFPLKLTEVACLIQNGVSPHCGDKSMARRCTRRSVELLSHDVISLECERKHSNVASLNERQNNVTSCTKCSLHQNIISILI